MDVVCNCGEKTHIKKQLIEGSVVWVIECPKCQVKVMAMNKNTAIRNFNK